MIRDTARLTDRLFDVVVVGSGIFGASAAWEASLRGLSVALMDKADFCQATSANHFKMVHCGIRYLQHADIRRLRESSRERSALLRIAPHLVHTLPIVIPTYGSGVKGKTFLGAGMLLYDALTVDRNRGLLQGKRIRSSRFWSSSDLLRRFPGVQRQALTGAAVFEEGQMYNPPRLALAFVRSAAERGAVPANYVEVTGFLKQGGRVIGVRAHDLVKDVSLEVRGRVVLNTAGPWAHRIMESDLGLQLRPRPTFSRDLAFVIPRKFQNPCGLALATDTRDADSVVDRGGRHLFAVPWRTHTLIGVWHKIFHQPPEALTVSREELLGYADEVNRVYPGMIDSLDDIQLVNMGLTLFGDENHQDSGHISFGHRSQVIDHRKTHNLEGLLTLIGVRATTARGMSVKAVDLIARRLGKNGPFPDSASVPLHGGHFQDLDGLEQAVRKFGKGRICPACAYALARNYGSAYGRVLSHADGRKDLLGTLGETTVLRCEVLHAVREEMAQTLADVVLRRTDLGSGSMPAPEALEGCASLMAEELGWKSGRIDKEIQAVQRSYFWPRQEV